MTDYTHATEYAMHVNADGETTVTATTTETLDFDQPIAVEDFDELFAQARIEAAFGEAVDRCECGDCDDQDDDDTADDDEAVDLSHSSPAQRLQYVLAEINPELLDDKGLRRFTKWFERSGVIVTDNGLLEIPVTTMAAPGGAQSSPMIEIVGGAMSAILGTIPDEQLIAGMTTDTVLVHPADIGPRGAFKHYTASRYTQSGREFDLNR